MFMSVKIDRSSRMASEMILTNYDSSKLTYEYLLYPRLIKFEVDIDSS